VRRSAGIGWAIGANYKTFDHDFRYLEIAVVVGIVSWWRIW
jgi:hypothetical protein